MRNGPHRVVLASILGGLVPAGLLWIALHPESLDFRPLPLTAIPADMPSRRAQTDFSLRPVRVMLRADSNPLVIASDRGLSVQDRNGRELGVLPPGPTPIRGAASGTLRLGAATYAEPEFLLADAASLPLKVSTGGMDDPMADRRYPGRIRVRTREGGGVEVINEVDVEAYVASVVAVEAWPSFDVETLRIQAIVARSYVLFHMDRRQAFSADVVATQGSQVYRGIRTDAAGRRAAEAAEYTRGVVCAFDDRGHDRLFCSYYSAACGGLSQPASIFGPEGDVPPLVGGVRCDYCKIAPPDFYRWGPVRLSKSEIGKRLLFRFPHVDALKDIRRAIVLEETPAGRPTVLRITGDRGDPFDLLAERFRHAIGPSEIRSTDFRMRDLGGSISFENGRGFGHGMGLCQWGAQGQVRKGRRAADVIRYYFPDSKLTRIY